MCRETDIVARAVELMAERDPLFAEQHGPGIEATLRGEFGGDMPYVAKKRPTNWRAERLAADFAAGADTATLAKEYCLSRRQVQRLLAMRTVATSDP